MSVMATGGYLKQNKCYVSLSYFHFKNGKACLKKKGQLDTTPVMIPQPGQGHRVSHQGYLQVVGLLDSKRIVAQQVNREP